MTEVMRNILDLLPIIAILLIAIKGDKQEKKIKELEKKIEIHEAAENLNEIERQINQHKEM